MNTLNFIGFLIIIITLFLLYNASETGPFIFKNNQVHNIIINREFFEPNDITIDLGDEVIWKSHDYVLRHTVVNDNPLIRNSDILLKGDEFNIIFDTPGDYVFYSSLYPNFEKGIVRVRNVKSGNKFRRELKKNILTVFLNIYRIYLKTGKNTINILKIFLFNNLIKILMIFSGLLIILGFYMIYSKIS